MFLWPNHCTDWTCVPQVCGATKVLCNNWDPVGRLGPSHVCHQLLEYLPHQESPILWQGENMEWGGDKVDKLGPGGQDRQHWCMRYPNSLSWPSLPAWSNLDLHQQYCWCRSKLTYSSCWGLHLSHYPEISSSQKSPTGCSVACVGHCIAAQGFT